MVNTLYIGAAGTASLDFRDQGKITSISIMSDDAALGAAEVSFNSSSQLTTNDTTGVVAGVILPGTSTSHSHNFGPMAESVDVGERIYLHVSGANKVRALIYTDAGGQRPATRRR